LSSRRLCRGTYIPKQTAVFDHSENWLREPWARTR
jgi:hypothetical protein